MLGTEVEHFLGFGDATNGGAGEILAAHRYREGVDGDRSFRDADRAECGVALEQGKIGRDVVGCGNAIEDEVEAAGVPGGPTFFLGQDDFVRAELFRVFYLGWRGGELDRVGSEGVGELERHVAETAEADHADLLAGASFPVLQRRVGGDAGAEEWSGGGGVKILRNSEDERFVCDDVVAVATKGDIAVLVL